MKRSAHAYIIFKHFAVQAPCLFTVWWTFTDRGEKDVLTVVF